MRSAGYLARGVTKQEVLINRAVHTNMVAYCRQKRRSIDPASTAEVHHSCGLRLRPCLHPRAKVTPDGPLRIKMGLR